MRAVVQRVKEARVKTNKKTTKIKKGFLVLLAATHSDNKEDVDYLAKKIANLRIVSDEKGLMNKSLFDVKGQALVVSQFTLYARTRKGNRPSFIDAAEPKLAKKLYETFIEKLKEYRIPVETGTFGEYMLVSLSNDGPVTIILDSEDRNKPRKISKP